MKIHSMRDERNAIRQVAILYDKTYPTEQILFGGLSSVEISLALHALNVETATAEDVAKIVGNTSWVPLPECENCGKVTREAVGFDGDYLDQYDTPWVCLDCLRLAVHMLEAGP